MKSIIVLLESIGEWTGKIFSWSTSLMVWTIFGLVVMRYGFGAFSQKASELATYFFAISFLFASGYALKHEKHVRVDLFYAKWSDYSKAWVNLVGTLLFLLPWCVVAMITAFKYAMVSFERNEVSDQPSGLPAVYVLKFILFLGFFLLLIQGLAMAFKAVEVLRGKATYAESSDTVPVTSPMQTNS